MTVSDEGNMRPADPEADNLLEQIENVVRKWIEPYLQEINDRSESFSDKVINDSVWGPIRLYPWEVAILDSPIIQRLRVIRQLGVVHWV